MRGPFFSQTRFPRLWLILQKLAGGTRDKQKLATLAWNGETHILEIGCSVGNISETFLGHNGISFTGIDIDAAAIAVARQRFAKHKNFLFQAIPVAEHAAQGVTYDYILVAGMLHHVDDETARDILRSTKTLAAAGAKIVVYEPDALRQDDPWRFKMFYKLEQGRFLRPHEALKGLLLSSGLHIRQESLYSVSPGFPGLPAVARFSYFTAAWEAIPQPGA